MKQEPLEKRLSWNWGPDKLKNLGYPVAGEDISNRSFIPLSIRAPPIGTL